MCRGLYFRTKTSFFVFKETIGKLIIDFFMQWLKSHRNRTLIERTVWRIEDLRHQVAFAARENEMCMRNKLYIRT